jgi:hypothetical protein
LHGDAFALNSFLAFRPHPLHDGVPTFTDGRPQGWGEIMPDATSHFIWAIGGKTNKFL